MVDENAGMSTEEAILLVLLRIYDVEMAKLTVQSKTAAENLAESHAQGRLIGSMPYLAADTAPDAEEI